MSNPNRTELACAEVWGGNGRTHRHVLLPGLDGVVLSQPCDGGRGGDVYYVSACSSGLFARVYLADVVGHGEVVAQMGAWLHDTLRARINRHNTARVFDEVNRHVMERGYDALTTAACFTYESRTGEMNYCYAGHPPILHYRPGEAAWRRLPLEEPGDRSLRNLSFGAAEGVAYDVGRCRVEPGDLLVLYSDGLTETPSPEGVLFGEERLLECLRTRPEGQCGNFVDALMESVCAFAQKPHLDHDDVTVLVFRVGPRVGGSILYNLVKNRLRRRYNLVKNRLRRRRLHKDAPPDQ